MRYNRADIRETLDVALHASRRDNRSYCVYALAGGWTIGYAPPGMGHGYYHVRPTGVIETYEYRPREGTYVMTRTFGKAYLWAN